MKKFLLILLMASVVATTSIASTSFGLFSMNGPQWSAMFSHKLGNLYLLGLLGTTGAGGAVGFTTTQTNREKVGFLNVITGQTSYTAALGVNLYQLVPAAYFEYETNRTMLPFFYDLKFVAGNYGLPNFGVTLNGREDLSIANISLYAQEHFKLIFQTSLESLGIIEGSYDNIKGNLLITDEVGTFYTATAGIPLGFTSLDLGIGYNGEEAGMVFGLSIPKASMDSGWWIRYMPTATSGPALFLVWNGNKEEFTAGYSRGAVYISLDL